MKKVLIVGAFDLKTLDTGGQPVKTRELFYGLSERYGNDQVDYLETIGWKKHPLSLFFEFKRKAKEAENIIMLPAHNGLFVFSKLLLNSKKKNKNKIFYDVVGGWLSEKTKNNPKLLKRLKEFDGIWVETSLMKKQLNEQGLDNITIVRNFKNLKVEDKRIEKDENNKQLKLCTFSRVMQEKGIEDAVEAVKIANQSLKDKNITLDIYGKVNETYQESFDKLMENVPNYVQYKGVVPTEKSVDILSEYDVLLFLTYYEGEGLAGTLIDAFSSGLAVIASDWKYNSEFIIDGINGLLVNIKDPAQVARKILYLLENKNKLEKMKHNSFEKHKEFSKDVVIEKIVEIL